MAGANVIVYGNKPAFTRWTALDKGGKRSGKGNLRILNVESPSFPDSYKLLPLKGIQSYQQWTFMDDNDKETVTYDTFISTESPA